MLYEKFSRVSPGCISVGVSPLTEIESGVGTNVATQSLTVVRYCMAVGVLCPPEVYLKLILDTNMRYGTPR